MIPEAITRLQNATSVLIVLSKHAKRDSIAAGLALQIALMQESKRVFICSRADLSSAAGLAGVDKISSKLNLGGNTLKISIPYKEGEVEDVSYNIAENKFNILVSPAANTQPLSSDGVEFTYTGGSVDSIVTLDAPSLEDLGELYLDNSSVFSADKIINIDRRFDNKNFGSVNIVEKQTSSTSEIVYDILKGMRITLHPDAATNLYAGLVAATNNFSSFSTNAHTFQTASDLLTAGAKKASTAPRAPWQQTQQQTSPITPDEEEENKPIEWLKPKIFSGNDK